MDSEQQEITHQHFMFDVFSSLFCAPPNDKFVKSFPSSSQVNVAFINFQILVVWSPFLPFTYYGGGVKQETSYTLQNVRSLSFKTFVRFRRFLLNCKLTSSRKEVDSNNELHWSRQEKLK